MAVHERSPRLEPGVHRESDTNRVDYIYVVNVGWDATINFALTDALKGAGWVIRTLMALICPPTRPPRPTPTPLLRLWSTSLSLLFSTTKLQAVTTNSTAYDLKVNGVSVAGGVKLASGTLTTTVTPVSMALNAKTQDFVFGGLEMSSVTLKLSDTLVASDLKFATGADTKFEKFVLGTTLTTPLLGVRHLQAARWQDRSQQLCGTAIMTPPTTLALRSPVF